MAVFWVLLAVTAAILAVVVWRLVVNDRTDRNVRVGVFYERHHDPPTRPPEPPRRPPAVRRDEHRIQWPPPRQDPDREPSHPGARRGTDT